MSLHIQVILKSNGRKAHYRQKKVLDYQDQSWTLKDNVREDEKVLGQQNSGSAQSPLADDEPYQKQVIHRFLVVWILCEVYDR